jgi:hypothetical protein
LYHEAVLVEGNKDNVMRHSKARRGYMLAPNLPRNTAANTARWIEPVLPVSRIRSRRYRSEFGDRAPFVGGSEAAMSEAWRQLNIAPDIILALMLALVFRASQKNLVC